MVFEIKSNAKNITIYPVDKRRGFPAFDRVDVKEDGSVTAILPDGAPFYFGRIEESAVLISYDTKKIVLRKMRENEHIIPDELKPILSGAQCPYCGGSSRFVDSQVVYGRGTSYGKFYYCKPCQAWVGVHKGTRISLGRLADRKLREWKKVAHALFDPLWKRKMEKDGIGKEKARRLAYNWAAKELDIHPNLCHIGYFDLDQCKQFVELVNKYQ